MKKNYYIFCHGFGFDSSFWDPLKPYFENEQTFYCDLGYFGEKRFPTEILIDKFNYIAIGHSFGLIELLNLPIPWSCALGLHGFIYFLGYDLGLNQIRLKEWRALRTQLKRAPRPTLELFYQRVGVSNWPDLMSINQARLLVDLERLILPPMHALPKKIAFLTTRNDTIVPDCLVQDNLNVHPQIQLHHFHEGMHALGHLFPEDVNTWCRQFLSAKN